MWSELWHGLRELESCLSALKSIIGSPEGMYIGAAIGRPTPKSDLKLRLTPLIHYKIKFYLNVTSTYVLSVASVAARFTCKAIFATPTMRPAKHPNSSILLCYTIETTVHTPL